MTARPTVLFVCVHIAGRSQLAAGLAASQVGGRVKVTSAGTAPEDRVSPVVLSSLAEVGVDWSGRAPTRLTLDAVTAADVVVALKLRIDLPFVDGVRYETWSLPEPAHWDVDGIRPLREYLSGRIAALVENLVPTI